MGRMHPAKALFVVSGAVLVFAYGVAVGHYHVFPFSILAFGKQSLDEVLLQRQMLAGVRPTEHLFTSRYDGDGVTLLDADRAFDGLTLISGFFGDGIGLKLIRLDGSEVARWPVSFHEIVQDSSHIEPPDIVPQTDWNTSILGAVAFPDGSIAFNIEAGAMVRMDRCGQVRWIVPRMVHHAIALAEAGGFWVPSQNDIPTDSPFPELRPPYREDTILRVSPDGVVERELSIPRILLENGLSAQLFANGPDGTAFRKQDETHLNDVDELSAGLAARFPQFEAGDLLLSLRNLNLVLVIDPDTETVKWHQTGPWLDQHDPDFTERGTISVFSNNNDLTPTGSILGGSTIVEVDPTTGHSHVAFRGRSPASFYTMYRGQHQILPNGNMLLSESMGGRALEVDRDGRPVWQFINRYDEADVASVNDVVRYPSEYFTVTDWTCPQ